MADTDAYALDDEVMRQLVDWSTGILADGRIAVTLELASRDGAVERRRVICHRIEAEYLGLGLREAAWSLISPAPETAPATDAPPKSARGRPRKTRGAPPDPGLPAPLPNGQANGHPAADRLAAPEDRKSHSE